MKKLPKINTKEYIKELKVYLIYSGLIFITLLAVGVAYSIYSPGKVRNEVVQKEVLISEKIHIGVWLEKTTNQEEEPAFGLFGREKLETLEPWRAGVGLMLYKTVNIFISIFLGVLFGVFAIFSAMFYGFFIGAFAVFAAADYTMGSLLAATAVVGIFELPVLLLTWAISLMLGVRFFKYVIGKREASVNKDVAEAVVFALKILVPYVVVTSMLTAIMLFMM